MSRQWLEFGSIILMAVLPPWMFMFGMAVSSINDSDLRGIGFMLVMLPTLALCLGFIPWYYLVVRTSGSNA
jgi:hypothetical protein